MRESYWGYWIILLGIFVIVIMMLISNLTTTNTQDYYLIKEVTEASMVDAVDLAYYRQSGELKIKYVSSYKNKTGAELLKNYQKNYQKEMEIGKTLIGVHHDDIAFVIDNNNLKEWGSEGQRKNAIISFKLAEINVIKDLKKYYPILILDDLFSELDKEKITNILKLLNNEVQTFITTTEINKIDKRVIKDAKKFKVDNGTVKEEK